MKTWENKEIEILLENYPNIGANGCSKILNKTIKQITSKANRLNLIFLKRFERYDYENFKKIVDMSVSISDVSRNLGLSTGRGNRKTIKLYIEKYKIPTTHFKIINLRKPETRIKQSLENILVSGSTYSNIATLKRRLYKSELLKPICSLCSQNEYWNGMKISLILDHINGINNDHRLINLRILCPNCNAGQDTFCRGSLKKKIMRV